MRAIQILFMSLAVSLPMTQRLIADELLIFSAGWCGHCKVLKADLEKDPSIVDGYEWGFIDTDKEKELARMYKVRNLPTLIVVDGNNNEVKRQVGYEGPEKLRRWLKNDQPYRTGVRHARKDIYYTGGWLRGRKFRFGWDY